MKNSQNGLPELDELDLMLVQELEKDARASYLALASKLGTSQPTVRRRFNRLVEQGAIAISAIPAYATLGYTVVLALAINAPRGTLNTLAGQLTSINSIKYAWITAGRYDILAIALFRDHEEYLTSFQEELGSIPGNVRIETIFSIKLIKNIWSHLTDASAVAPRSRVTLTELDLQVIGGLEKYPRIPAKELAHNIGASVSSVRASLRKVTSQGIIRVIVFPDPASLGHNVTGMALIQVHPSSLKTLTDTLKVHPSVKMMTLTYGAFNCMIWASFRNSAEMYDFLDQDLANIPGVLHFENLVYLKRIKQSFSLVSDNRSDLNGPE